MSNDSNAQIRPLQDRIIVERLNSEEKTASGLFIPDTAKEKPQQGKVIAVGKGKVKDDGSHLPVDLKAGDVILFGKYAGTEVKIGEKDDDMVEVRPWWPEIALEEKKV